MIWNDGTMVRAVVCAAPLTISPVMLEVYAREHAPLVGNAVTRLGL